MNRVSMSAFVAAALLVLLAAPTIHAEDQVVAGTYRGLQPVVKFDVSPPLRTIAPLPVKGGGEAMVDPEGRPGELGPQDIDPIVQSWVGGTEAIPAPLVSFDGPSNIAGVSPPDPVGDVGPDHYVAMSNLYFQIYDKAGNSLYGPAANNTLWSGFGGDCQTDNAGDPIVLYDQLADRWILTQFTSSGPTFYNCVAISTSGDPTGSYYRYAVSTGANFPDYPKYGVWPDAYYISTREFDGLFGPFVGVGAYALSRADLIAGDPSPTIISFLMSPAAAGGAYNVGDGLLPSDMDGYELPPAGSPNYFVGSMDDGGQYGAPQDALTIWKYHADFVAPANSTFVLTDTVPITAYDTQFSLCSGRSCIPQPGTSNQLDILSYRQRPMHRLAYRNFGTHESLVTNQSVEAAPGIAGMRWWEVRDPDGTPAIYQEGTFAPGVSDGVHRWMGSIAQDSAGNMALGYSASSSTVYPSVWYTGRLAGDPLGTMPQGEGSIVDGTGSQTSSQRWGDYTSINIDPLDDCTFWYVNEYLPTSGSNWRLRIGAFRFDECGTPDFYLRTAPEQVQICAGSDAVYDVTVGSVGGFTDPVTLSAIGQPAGAAIAFSTNPVTPPGTSVMTISGTGGAAAGAYTINVVGVAPTSTHENNVGLLVFDAVPGTPTLTAPADGALNVPLQPTFEWTSAPQAASYTLEVDDDPAFGSPALVEAGIAGTSFTPSTFLNSNTVYYWRVSADNLCGAGPLSAVLSFTTTALPGDCGVGTVPVIHFSEDFEAGAPGWSSSGTGNTWAASTARVHGGTYSYHAVDVATISDQRLVSPEVTIPTELPTLQFWTYQEMEDASSGCYDGGILEISTDGGSSWTQLPTTVMQTDPYDGPISASFSNPLANLDAWCGDPQDWLKSVVDLSAYAGQTASFRFRLGTDSSVSREGWYIDDAYVQSCEGGAPSLPFADGFESGDTSGWSATVP